MQTNKAQYGSIEKYGKDLAAAQNMWRARYEASAELQAEFPNVDHYLAYQTHEFRRISREQGRH